MKKVDYKEVVGPLSESDKQQVLSLMTLRSGFDYMSVKRDRLERTVLAFMEDKLVGWAAVSTTTPQRLIYHFMYRGVDEECLRRLLTHLEGVVVVRSAHTAQRYRHIFEAVSIEAKVVKGVSAIAVKQGKPLSKETQRLMAAQGLRAGASQRSVRKQREESRSRGSTLSSLN
jgi:hypothetical protein